MAFDENWEGKQIILVILAHPDDPDFFCGATIARWTSRGHDVHYLLFTKGDKGSNNPVITPEELINIRIKEQRAAADVLGVNIVSYLDKLDGYVMADLESRKEIVRSIRMLKPDIVVSCDPANLYTRDGYINHPDHRSVGQQVIDALYPGVGNRFYFPELIGEGCEPHQVKELWLSIPADANTVIDVTEYWNLKVDAISKHQSQIGAEIKMRKRMLNRRHPQSTPEQPRFDERFKRIIFK
ncbi:MAG: PIG-L deacetylase family protein [Anaerolineaceae bacterium]